MSVFVTILCATLIAAVTLAVGGGTVGLIMRDRPIKEGKARHDLP